MGLQSDASICIITMTSQKITQKSSVDKFLDAVQPFWIGGLSGMIATSVIQPIDMVKVLIQIKSEQGQKATPATAIADVMAKDGIKGFYRGLSAALTRQMFYTTTRMGLYKTVAHKVQASNKEKGQKTLSFFQKAYCASFAGFVGALVGNPADLALVRMQADNQLPMEQRRNYKNVVDAFARIVKDEGVMGLWRGATPTVIRAMVLNLAMLATYDEAKELMLHTFKLYESETLELRIIASFASGLVSSFACLPFDNAKTKLQKMKAGADGKMPYKNIFDTMLKTVRKEGFGHLWVGYLTFYLRIAPHVGITLILQDYLTHHMRQWRTKKE